MTTARTFPTSENTGRARALVEALQGRFLRGLSALGEAGFREKEWLRDEGRHGGGSRFEARESPLFRGASINVSVVHYDDEPDRRLASATALSTIIHPRHPRCPSVHMHFSWTELRGQPGYWRGMIDLNPALLPEGEGKERFAELLRQTAPELVEEAFEQGDKYFAIPALNRHRGVIHYYLEGYRTDDFERDLALMERLGAASIDGYCELLKERLGEAGEPLEEELRRQREYHTVYLFQVLTLDRGTTSGLLVHDQNDLGIMASLPPVVDRDLLASWGARVPAPQEKLVAAIVETIPETGVVDDEVRGRLAKVLREHYREHPEALSLQARGDKTPTTVGNHGTRGSS